MYRRWNRSIKMGIYQCLYRRFQWQPGVQLAHHRQYIRHLCTAWNETPGPNRFYARGIVHPSAALQAQLETRRTLW